ncbi:MAG: recombination mediator RecR [Candidatus Omnitrophica bacterium]|nr:recombination mediator RecR [Candidatus Omnitrophota bacterium]
MEIYPSIIKAIIEQFKKLPGIGSKSAERIVEYLLEMDETELLTLAENLKKLKKDIKKCKYCLAISDQEICQVCSDPAREKKIAIVEQYKDVIALEKAGFRGRYHVLGGKINFLEKIGPENLSINHLLERIEKERFDEIIIATNATPEGETTAMYLMKILKNKHPNVSRLATGIPVGAEIEYIDPETLRKSIENRLKT